MNAVRNCNKIPETPKSKLQTVAVVVSVRLGWSAASLKLINIPYLTQQIGYKVTNLAAHSAAVKPAAIAPVFFRRPRGRKIDPSNVKDPDIFGSPAGPLSHELPERVRKDHLARARVCVCVYMCVLIRLCITAQPGPDVIIFICYRYESTL